MSQINQLKTCINNFRRFVAASEIKGAPPFKNRRIPGHARSKHGIKVNVQADILNSPERIFSGANKYGREVDIYYKSGSLVITEAGLKHSLITAYGLADVKHPKPKAVSPDKWVNDPAYF
jgi:hypothetical protein